MLLFMFLTLIPTILLMIALPEPWSGVVFATWWIASSVYAMSKEPMYYPDGKETYRDRFYKEASKQHKKTNDKPLIIDVK